MSSLRLWITTAIVTLMAAGSSADDLLSCVKCGRYIREGQYVQVGDQYFHPEHFVCANCGRPIGTGQYFAKDGRFYDKACYTDVFSLRCAWCGQPIEGQYTIRDGRNYHKECFLGNVAPKCAWCKDVITDSSIISAGKSYHNRCFFEHVALRCLLCDSTIEGEYMTSFRGGAWHKWHQGNVPECDMCSGFIDLSKRGTYLEFADDRYLCALCGESAITDVDDIKSLADTLAPILAGMGMVVNTEDLVFKLADKSEMLQLGDRDKRNQRGFTDFRQFSTLFGLIKDQHLTVTLLDGMPRMECIKVLAHELTHVWLFSSGRSKTAPQLCEGSCNYVSLLVLQQYPGDESKFLISKLEQDTDPVYGDGYRHVKEWVERVGVSKWVEYLRTQDKNPW